jgi:hypothetical protein
MPHEPFIVTCRNEENSGEERVAARYRTELAATQAARRFNANAARFGKRLSYFVFEEEKAKCAPVGMNE